MKKKHIITLLSLLVFILFFGRLQSQSGADIVYLKDGSVQRGKIQIENIEGEDVYLFLSQSQQRPIELSPKLVDRFAIFSSSSKKKPIGLFISRTEQGFLREFFKQLYDSKFPIYRSTKSGRYYIQFENAELSLISPDKTSRKQFFDQYLPDTLWSIGANAYADNLSSFKRFSNFLTYSQTRYPNRYIGLRLTYGTFSMKNYTSISSLGSLYPNNPTFIAQRFGASVYINEGLNKRGNLAYQFSAGGRITESNGYSEDASNITTHAIRGTHAFSNFLVYRYFRFGKSHPFIGFGADVNLLLQENSLLASFDKIEAGYDLETYFLETFKAISYSPLLRFGVELPVNKQYFLILESAAASVTDALNKRILLLEFSVGINLL